MLNFLYKYYDINSHQVSRVIKEGNWVVFNQFLIILGHLGLIKILTEHLMPTDLGEISLYLIINILIFNILMGPISQTVLRYYSIANKKKDLFIFFKVVKKILEYITLIILGILLLVIFCLFVFNKTEYLAPIIIIFLFSIFTGFNSIFINIHHAARERINIFIIEGFSVLVKLASTLIAIYYFEASVINVVISFLFSSIFITIIHLFFLKKSKEKKLIYKNKKKINHNWFLKIVFYSTPFSFFAIFTSLHLMSDRFAIEKFGSMIDLGKYFILYQFGYASISIIIGLISTLITPIIFNRAGDATKKSQTKNTKKLFSLMIKASFIICSAGFLFLLIFHKWLFQLVVGENFHDISYYLPWVFLSGCFFSVGQLLVVKILTSLKSTIMVNIKIVTSIFGIITNIVGTWLFGLSGLIFSTLIFSVIYFIWMSLIVIREK